MTGLAKRYGQTSALAGVDLAVAAGEVVALLGRPPLLLLDEPTAGADVATRRDLLALVRRLAEEGSAVLYSTHYLHEVEQLDARVVIIEDGRVLARGTVRELLAAHATSAVELSFDGPAPALSLPPPAEVSVNGRTARVTHPDPTVTAAAALDALGDERRRLQSVEIVRPSLESVYLALTGRRYAPQQPRRPSMSPGASAALARHELRIMRQDPSTIVFMLIMPILMTALMRPLYQAALVQEGVTGATGAEHAVPGMAVAFAAFSVGFSGFAFFREHGWGTWERLRASAASSGDIMAGKLLPVFLVTALQIGLLLGLGVLLFGLTLPGSAVAAAAVVVGVSLSLTAFGMAVTAVSRTSQQLNAIGSVGGMVFGVVGGAFVPVAVMPNWAQTLAPATPTYWAMRGFRSVTLDTGGIGEVALPVVMLVGLAAVFAVVAALRFRFEESKVYFG